MASPSEMCATHNKKRGERNLQPHPSSPGLFVCLDHDQCIGSGGTPGTATYGAAASTRNKPRFSPYGASPTEPGVCALHGKKRGARNLQPSPTVPGTFICLDDDQCKGAVPRVVDQQQAMPSYSAPAPGTAGPYGGFPPPPPSAAGGPGPYGMPQPDYQSGPPPSIYPPQMGGYTAPAGVGSAPDPYGAGYANSAYSYDAQPQYEQAGYEQQTDYNQQYGLIQPQQPQYETVAAGGGSGYATSAQPENPSTYRGGGLSSSSAEAGNDDTCATHGKKRGQRYLQPHPTTPGLSVCSPTDPCMTGGGGGGGGGGGSGAVGGDLCAVHGKRRGARNLQADEAGRMICMPHDQCK